MSDKIIEVKGLPIIKFQKAKRIEQLRRGEMHMSSLRVYRELATKSSEIGDDYEAALHINEATAYITPINGGGSTTMLPINNELIKTIHSNGFVFCMFGVNSKSNHFQFNEEQKSKMLEFGDTALIITDSKEFHKRVRNALVDKGISLENSHCGFVDYYDEAIDSADILFQLMKGMHNIAFQKRKKYEYQHEYQFFIPNDDESIDYLDLQIGDISDISEVISSANVLKGFLSKSK